MSLWLASRCLASPRFCGEVSACSKCRRAELKSACFIAARPAFAAFPRLKPPAGKILRGFFGLTDLVVKRAAFNRQIVALLDEIVVLFQFAQSSLWFYAEPFPKLVAFVKQPGISRVGLECLVISCARLGRFAEYVEVANTEIAPNDGKAGVQFRAALPQPDRLAVPPAVIQQISEIIRRARVRQVRAHG